MNRAIIAITDDGVVTAPNGVRMTVCEIADVFGVYYPTVKRYIRDIEKATSTATTPIMLWEIPHTDVMPN